MLYLAFELIPRRSVLLLQFYETLKNLCCLMFNIHGGEGGKVKEKVFYELESL